MRFGIIDLGTNSVRFDVHQLGPGTTLRLLHREKLMVRLGQGVFLSGKLDSAAVRRTLHAFLRFQEVGAKLRVGKILAFGTSALRDVTDRERFVETIRNRTGIEIRVISGTEEAKLIALGVLSNEKIPKGRFALVDIGGGSMEISLCDGRKILGSASLQLGTARLQQVFLKKNPPDPESLRELRLHIRNEIYREMLAQKWPKADRILGSSGTIRALARILRKKADDNNIEKAKLSALIRSMSGMTTAQLLAVPRMETKRVDMILAGAVLFEECMDALGAKKAQATEYSLRDGLLVEEQLLLRQGATSHLEIHLPDLYEKARKFGGDPKHLERVAKLAGAVFDRLKPVHKLGEEWRIYLISSTILRDLGEFIGLSRHPQHTRYIIENTDLPPMEEWETEFIANLCYHHQGQKPEPKAIPFGKHKARWSAFLKLLALLRLVDALDSGANSHPELRSVRIARGRVLLQVGGKHMSGLEVLNVELQSPFFKKIFKRDIEAVPA